MASANDTQDPYTDPNASDPAQLPAAGSSPTGPQPYDYNYFVNQLTNLYQTYYNRPPTQDEINSHWGNPGGLSAIEKMLQATKPVDTPPPTPPTPPTPPPTPPTPIPGPTNGGNTGITGGLLAPYPGVFTPPAPIDLGGYAGIVPGTPSFTGANAPPTLGTPAPLQLAQWQAPTVAEALNDPGYQFRVQQGSDALQNWAAARGTLNDSGTAKALMDYGQNAASSEYANVWNRDFNAWNQGNQNALNQYMTNYGTQYSQPYQAQMAAWNQSVYNPTMTAYNTLASAGQTANQNNYANAWNQFLQDYSMYTNQQNNVFNKLYTLATS